ncbi:MAG: rhombosortase [Saccharospirillum sp.]
MRSVIRFASNLNRILSRMAMPKPPSRQPGLPVTTLVCLLACSSLTLLASWAPLSSWLAYDQSWLEQRHLWRPLTASLAQLHWKHWLLNQWGLVVMALLLPARPRRADALAMAFVWLVVSASLPLSGYADYAGLSGVLYGWLIWSLLNSPHYPPWLMLTAAVGLSLKVVIENLPGGSALFNASTAAFIDAEVAVRAHLFGLVSGWLAVLVARWRQPA